MVSRAGRKWRKQLRDLAAKRKAESVEKRSTRPDVVWYYADLAYYRKAVECGAIEAQATTAGPLPAAWFIAHVVGPSLSREALGRTPKERHYEGEMVRIAIPVQCAPFTWKEYRMRCGDSPEQVDSREREVRAEGFQPEIRYAALVPVPASEWIKAEHWVDGEWKPLPIPE